MPESELLLDVVNKLGEGPLWHARHGHLYWTDIEDRTLYRFGPGPTGDWEHETQEIDMRVGGLSIQEDGSLVLFGDNGRVVHCVPSAPGSAREWHFETWIESLAGEDGLRFNDGAADSEGRAYFGTYGARPGRLYRFDTDGGHTVVADGIGCSNGIGWSLDQRFMYHTDSQAKTVSRYRYDALTGDLTEREVWMTWSESGVPDGLTVDAAGNVWVAVWDGACVVKFDAQGSEVLRVPVPVDRPTCPAFGGEGLMDLFVTSSGGGLFVIRGVGPGMPEGRSRLTPPRA